MCLRTTDMKKDEVIKRLRAHKQELRNMGVTSLALFGSVVRDQAREGSDIDLLVEFDRPVGVFHLFSVKHRIEEILAVSEVDLVQRGAVHPALRERIYGETVNVA
jgi:predicted nucleotidyltransferase